MHSRFGKASTILSVLHLSVQFNGLHVLEIRRSLTKFWTHEDLNSGEVFPSQIYNLLITLFDKSLFNPRGSGHDNNGLMIGFGKTNQY